MFVFVQEGTSILHENFDFRYWKTNFPQGGMCSNTDVIFLRKVKDYTSTVSEDENGRKWL
jgi:hypothetical protein